ncbi:MAG: biopolymer transporter ExbD [Deltaproteobacteria bacterium]|nr:biopolymer transporter ExbD [Deltaproteobacteria bacterium]
MGKKTRRPSANKGLSITSLMDMMTIILVFLLKSYGSDDIAVKPSADMQLPVSTSLAAPKLAVNVMVSQKEIVVDGVGVLLLTRHNDEKSGEEVAAVPADEKHGQLISKLYERLLEKAEQAKDLASRTGNREEFEFKGEILLQCDKNLPFSVVREVMYTAGQAQFGNFRFVVVKGSD